VLAQGPSPPEVDPYRKYQPSSLYNPEKLGELGTQMYPLNQWHRSFFVSELETNHYSVAMALCVSSF